jgi:hypothetical protein
MMTQPSLRGAFITLQPTSGGKPMRKVCEGSGFASYFRRNSIPYLDVGNRVNTHAAPLYDAPGDDSISHMNRDIGLAWLNLPLTIPVSNSK